MGSFRYTRLVLYIFLSIFSYQQIEILISKIDTSDGNVEISSEIDIIKCFSTTIDMTIL